MDYFKLIQSFEFLSEEFGICWISKANASFNHLNTGCFSTDGWYNLAYLKLRSEEARLLISSPDSPIDTVVCSLTKNKIVHHIR